MLLLKKKRSCLFQTDNLSPTNYKGVCTQSTSTTQRTKNNYLSSESFVCVLSCFLIHLDGSNCINYDLIFADWRGIQECVGVGERWGKILID